MDQEGGINITSLVMGDLRDPDSIHEELASMLRARDQSGSDSDGLLDHYLSLTKRGGRQSYEVCGTKLQGNGQTYSYEMKYTTPAYPEKGQIKHLFDSKNWESCTEVVMTRKNTNEEHKNRKYIQEHILERQTLQHFFVREIEYTSGGVDGDGNENDDVLRGPPAGTSGLENMCHFMKKYWDEPINGVRPLDKVAAAWPDKTTG